MIYGGWAHAMAAGYYFLHGLNRREKSARAVDSIALFRIHHLRSYLFDILSRTDESLQGRKQSDGLDRLRGLALALALLYAQSLTTHFANRCPGRGFLTRDTRLDCGSITV